MRIRCPTRRARYWAAVTSWCLLGSALACLSLWSAGTNFDCDTVHQQLAAAQKRQQLFDLDSDLSNNLGSLIEAARNAVQLNDRDHPDDAAFRLHQTLVGALLLPAGSSPAATDWASGRKWTAPELVEHNVTLAVAAAFSPHIEDHARLMFEDKFGECRFHALGPAMAVWQGEVVACVRLFQPQYVLARGRPKPAPMDTWQENYVYAMRLRPDDYEPLDTGRLLGIPTPTNGRFPYKKDGPLDPRAFVYRGRLYLLYYSYGMPSPNTTSFCRMYFWDYKRSVKHVISVSGLSLQKADINWTPLVVGGDTLYLIYTFDPLRVLHCDPDAGRCKLHYTQPGAERFPFDGSADVLRGGTPFVEYSHPYYVSVAHSSARLAARAKPNYAAHLAVVCVDTWRLVYVSGALRADEQWLRHVPLVLSDYVAAPFWYPTALLRRSDRDTFDVGCHLNDHSSYVLRLTGLGRLLADVTRRDASASGGDGGGGVSLPPPRAAQQFVFSDSRRRMSSAMPSAADAPGQLPQRTWLPPATQPPPQKQLLRPSPPKQPTQPEQSTPPKQPTLPKQPMPPKQPTTLTPPKQPKSPEQPTPPKHPTTLTPPTQPKQPTTLTPPTQPKQPTLPIQATPPKQSPHPKQLRPQHEKQPPPLMQLTPTRQQPPKTQPTPQPAQLPTTKQPPPTTKQQPTMTTQPQSMRLPPRDA